MSDPVYLEGQPLPDHVQKALDISIRRAAIEEGAYMAALTVLSGANFASSHSAPVTIICRAIAAAVAEGITVQKIIEKADAIDQATKESKP